MQMSRAKANADGLISYQGENVVERVHTENV
jgi:hypothetical protein